MTHFIFLGPSLPRAAAQAILPAEYLDPIAMGDLYTLVRTKAKAGDSVAIIDGYFEQVPSVWHKEVLFAIQSGIQVYGAASMGALRAAELHSFGMIGVGRIFEAYRDGVIEDDDEVAVAHAPAAEQFRPLSTAMVSIRFGLLQLQAEGTISEAECDSLMAHAKSRYYSRRSWADLYAHAKGIGMAEWKLIRLRNMNASDAKADDAVSLLRLLSEGANGAPPATSAAPGPAFILEQTEFWKALVRAQEMQIALVQRDGVVSNVLDADISAHVRASLRSRKEILRDALLIKFAVEQIDPADLTAADLLAAKHQIARRNGLHTSEDLGAWLAAQKLDDQGWKSLLQTEASVEKLVQRSIVGLDTYLMFALKASGCYGSALQAVEQLLRRFGNNRQKELTLEDYDVTPEQLEKWYRQQFGPMLPNPEMHARSLGYETLGDFVVEVLGAYLLEVEQASNGQMANGAVHAQLG